MIVRHCRECHYHHWQPGIVVSIRNKTMFFETRNHGWHLVYFRTGRYWAKVFFYQFYDLIGRYISTNSKRCVIWTIPAQKEILQVVYIDPVEVLHIADRKPGIGMSVGI